MLIGDENIWITGAQGQVGSTLAHMLSEMRLNLLLTDREEVDVTDMEAVRSYAEMYRPDVIINCAGVCGVEFCEKNSDLAYKVNAIGARNLSVAARSVHAKLVQISTDDIFDGEADAPYNEFSVPAPKSIYGRSKMAGEEFVRTIASRHLIIRSSWVYGNGENYVTALLKKARETGEIQAPEDQFGSPTSAAELARAVCRLLDADAYGLYHVVCRGVCSRKTFAERILKLSGSSARVMGVGACRSKAPADGEGDAGAAERAGADGSRCAEAGAPALESGRPAYAVLDNLMLRLDGIALPRDWESALEEYMRELKVDG